ALADRSVDEWQRAGHVDGARRYEDAAAVLLRIGWDRLDRDAPTESLAAFERALERVNTDSELAWEARAGIATATYANGNSEAAQSRMRDFEERAPALSPRLRILARRPSASPAWRGRRNTPVT